MLLPPLLNQWTYRSVPNLQGLMQNSARVLDYSQFLGFLVTLALQHHNLLLPNLPT